MILQRLLVAVGRPLVWLIYRPRVRGRELVPAGRGCVLCPTHLSGFDAIAVLYALAPRPVRNMAKNELFRRPLLGPLVRSLGAFPAHDEDGVAGGVLAAAVFADRGDAVAIFPEGARRHGRDRRPHTGAARVALAAGVPLIPVALRGTDGWRERRRWQIAFDAPVDVGDLAGLGEDAAAREATRRMWDAVKRLEAELDA